MSPPPRGADQSALLIVLPEDAPPQVFAMTLEEEALLSRFDVQTPAALVWMSFEVSLQTLGLQEGAVELVEGGRPLPEGARAIFESVVDARGAGAWMARSELPEQALALRIALMGPEDCAALGGCFLSEEALAAGRCTTPCPDPVAFEPPTAPQPPLGLVEGPRYPAQQACPEGEVQWLDAGGCAPLSSCPAGPWPEGLSPAPGGRVIHVSPAAGQGGDGSMSAPYQRPSEALTMAQAGDIIALSEGEHLGELDVPFGVGVVGACASRSRLLGAVLGAPSRVEGLTIEPPDRAARALDVQGASVEVLGVILRGFARVRAGALTGGDVKIEGGAGAALRAIEGAQVSLFGVHLRGERGLLARQDSVVQLSRVAIVETSSLAIDAQEATVELSEALIERSGARIILAVRSQLDAEGLSVAGGGACLLSALEARDSAVSLTNTSFTEVEGRAIWMSGGSLQARDLEVLEPPRVDDCGRMIVLVDADSTIEGARLESGDGAGVRFEGGTGYIRDLQVVGSERARVEYARESLELRGAEVSGLRLSIVGAQGRSAVVMTSTATLVLSDLYVQNRRTARVIDTGDLSDVRLERVQIEGPGRQGMELDEDTKATIKHLRISDIEEAVITRSLSEVVLEDVLIERSPSFGICLRDLTKVDITRIWIEETGDRATNCPFGVPSGGAAIAVDSLAQLRMRGFVLSRSAQRGIIVTKVGNLLLREGLIQQNPVGVEMISDEAVGPLVIGVRYLDNEVDFSREF